MTKRRGAPRAPEPDTVEGREGPEVIVDFIFDRGIFHVAVANVSDVPAYLVSVKFDKAFRGLGGEREISSLPLFRRIQFLAPWKRIETFLDTSGAYFERREPTRIAALITYRDADLREYERRIVHDLRIYKDVSYLVRPADMASLPVSSATGEGLTSEIRRERNGNPPR
jgi:hypothetical protein